jgi:hypothetical protein
MALFLERRLYSLEIAELELRFRADVAPQLFGNVDVRSSDVPHAKAASSIDVSESKRACGPADDDPTDAFVGERIRSEKACFRHH